MKRALLYIFVLALTASSALPFAPVSSAANVNVRHTVIATTGEASPIGGNYLPFSFTNVRLNARHEVVFDATVGAPNFTTGVFVNDGKTTATVAAGANPDPAGPSFGLVTNPYITPNGDVFFDANNTDTYKSDGKTFVPILRDGDEAPGGGTLSPIGRVTNDHGVSAYSAILSGSTGTQGVFRSDEKETVAIARDDVAPPTGGVFAVFGNPVISDRGQVAFYSVMNGGLGDFGIFRGDGRELKPVFIANQIAPGGATFEDFSNPVINNSGQIAASASLTNGFGLFVGDGTNTVTIALGGQAAPKGGNYARGFFLPLRINDNGDVAFTVGLTGGTRGFGLFRGNGDHTTAVAISGTNAPGTTGVFDQFRDYQILNDGRIAVIATLTVGIGGVNTTNNMGIWIGTSDEDLQLVARTGDVIGGRVLTRLPQFGQGNQFEINENTVVWVGTFGTTKALVSSRVVDASDDVIL